MDGAGSYSDPLTRAGGHPPAPAPTKQALYCDNQRTSLVRHCTPVTHGFPGMGGCLQPEAIFFLAVTTFCTGRKQARSSRPIA